MTGDEIVEDAIGVVNGLNTNFQTPSVYQSGTLRVFLNGQLIRDTDSDGPTETGADTFDLGLPPLTGDTVRVRYLEA